MTEKEDQTLSQIRTALAQPDASIRFTYVFGRGRAAQVYVKSRKVGPFILPSEGQTLADVLHSLGLLMEGITPESEPPRDVRRPKGYPPE